MAIDWLWTYEDLIQIKSIQPNAVQQGAAADVQGEFKKQALKNDSSPADLSKCGKSAVLTALKLPGSTV